MTSSVNVRPIDLASSPKSLTSTSSTPSTYGFDTRFNRFSDLLASRQADEDGEDQDDYDDDECETDEEGAEVEGADSSAFTDPSSYGGSPIAARRESNATTNLWQPYPSPSTEDHGKGKLVVQRQPASPLTQKLDVYQTGLNMARRALLDLDAELDETKRADDDAIVRSAKSRGKQRQNAASTRNITSSGPLNVLPSYVRCPTYACAHCGTTLALQDELISKAFSGRDGKAYLFFSTLNIVLGTKEDRQLLTGLHTVADLSCATCQRSVGWSYIRAFEASQRYKEGKFILERAGLHKCNNWTTDDAFDGLCSQ